MRTVQQYYDDNRDKILFDVRALEEYEKETMEASIHLRQSIQRIHQYIFFATLDRKVKK